MAILDFNEVKGVFEWNKSVNLENLAEQTEKELFGDNGYAIIQQLIDPAIAARIRDFYTKLNASAFRSERSPLFTFHGQSLVLYYPQSPFPIPQFMMSIYEQLSLLRNMIYVNQKFYRDYCSVFNLDPRDYQRVYSHQIKHTWARVSWYKDRDGQCIHRDNYGEIAAFLMLTKKGVHWQEGGLYIHDQNGKPSLEVDERCEIGDVLWLDQNKVIHSVQPVLGANPGRLLFYIPIIPYGYMQPWYTFEGHPWKIYYTQDLSWPKRVQAHIQNAFNNVTRRTKVHYTRKQYPHAALALPKTSFKKIESEEALVH